MLTVYTVIAAASVVLHLAFERQPYPQELFATVALACAMPVLLTYLFLTAPRQRLVWVTAVALFFSWLGDAFGIFFLLKLLFFLVAQIAYCVAFWPYGRRVLQRLPLAIAYAAGIAAALAYVVSHADGLRVWVMIYGVTLALMAVLAFGLSLRAGIGGLLFVLSDIVLGLDAFVVPLWLTYPGALNSLLYLPAQALLTMAVARRAADSGDNPPD